MVDIHNIYHVFIIFVGSSSCLSPFGSPASSASSWLKKTMSSGKAPSLPNQLYHNDTTGNHSTKKKYSFFKVCLLASIKPSWFQHKHIVTRSSVSNEASVIMTSFYSCSNSSDKLGSHNVSYIFMQIMHK